MSEDRLRIGDIGFVYNRSQVEQKWSLMDMDNRAPFIFVPIDCEKFLTNSQIITNKMRDDDGLYVGLNPDYQKKVSYDYLMFEIGSIAGYVALFFSKDKMKFKKKLTKTQLLNFEFRKEDQDTQRVYGYSALIVSNMSMNISKHINDKYFQLRLSMFTDVRDSLSIAQIMQPSLKEMGVNLNLFNSWKALLDKNQIKENGVNTIFDALLDNKTEVMNDVRKVRILFTNLMSFANKIHDHDKVED
ncbi:MAG: hypothetical protein HXO36_06130 [Prevotella sp.]|jgi:hypothetical protein|uniref:hypothetical protein n=1 Tax=Prevotella sp. TaxID=59823 RepID=UPI001CADBA7C|nr:hypothetical protein [Prevotella sp.]MBF1613833.1 hypothetical protein [Prevotella sp.]